MADDNELKVDDRILAVDGTFVTNTTTHKEVMEMLENEVGWNRPKLKIENPSEKAESFHFSTNFFATSKIFLKLFTN